jgi:hypothetical protein
MIEAKKIVVEEKLELEQEMQQLALEASEKWHKKEINRFQEEIEILEKRLKYDCRAEKIS